MPITGRVQDREGPRRRLALLLAALFSLGASLACGADFGENFSQCPEPMLDEAPLRAGVMAHPLSGALGEQWTELSLAVSTCPLDGRVHVNWQYRAPASYSAFGLAYKTQVVADYVVATGVLEAVELAGQPVAAEAGQMAEALRGYIAEAERDARVAEFLGAVAVTDLGLTSPTVWYLGEDFGEQISYALDLHTVVTYNLPNDRDWPAFPEVARAQTLVETMLFTGELAGCTIRRGGLHASTGRKGVYASGDWVMTVNAECAGTWQEAEVRLHPDGSYSALGLQGSAP